ncbi:MAG: hypothetical protein IH901_01745, partial [Proteobacteria bacterium]|nr:hypothetical protein [Pseudomonadota bacterium]
GLIVLSVVAMALTVEHCLSIRRATIVPADTSQQIKALIPQMGLSSNDSAGRPLDYQAFTKDEGVHLRGVDTVGDVLKSGDEISLLPDIQAG